MASRSLTLLPRGLFAARQWQRGLAARDITHLHPRPWRLAASMDPARLIHPTGSSSSSSAIAAQPPQQPGSEPEEGVAPPKPRQEARFCRQCGGAVELVLTEGGQRWRQICGSCSYIDYQNPKMVVGCIVSHEGKILLCKRGIEPQRGLWTVPAGFMECNESTAEGAARETWEEAGAKVEVIAPYCHFDIPGISQAYILFRARLAAPFTFAAQEPESLDAQLFAPHEIPFEQLAFSSVAIALRHYLADVEAGAFHVHHGVILKRPGAGPNEPGSFSLEHHFAIPTTLPAE